MQIKAKPITLTLDQIDSYDSDGFLIVPHIYDKSACEKMESVARDFADSDFSIYLNIHRVSKFFLSILQDPVLVGMVKAVQRHKVVGLNDQYIYKKANTTYARQAWNPHQDSAYLQAPYGAYIQLHIFVRDHNRENGGLYYFSGSHKEKLLEYTYTPSSREPKDSDGISRPGWLCKVPDQYIKIDVDAPMGGICLQHGNIIHGSYPNFSSNLDRQQYSIAYINKGAAYDTGQTSTKIPVMLD